MMCNIPGASQPVESDGYAEVCVCAMRYCMGRQTYMPSIIMSYVQEHIGSLADKTLRTMVSDITFASKTGYGLGDRDIDRPKWLEFRDFLNAELERRNHER